MQLKFNKYVEIPETWTSAFFFFFKLFTAIMAVWLLVWHWVLPPDDSIWHPSYQQLWESAMYDFWFIAHQISLLYFVSAFLLVTGGLIQLWKRSGRSAWWNIGFGIFAVIVGIVLFIGVPPSEAVLDCKTDIL